MDRRVRVLLIEDDPDVRDLLAMALEDDPGIDVVGVACDLVDGETLFHVAEPDVVVVDLILPGPRIETVGPRMRAASPDLRVIVCSGLHRKDEWPRLGGFVADAYVEKMAAFKELAARVHSLVAMPVDRT